MEIVKMVFDLMRDWHSLGQFVFLCFVSMMATGGIIVALKLVVVLFRGWPPAGTPEVAGWGDDNEDDAAGDGARVTGATAQERVAPARPKS